MPMWSQIEDQPPAPEPIAKLPFIRRRMNVTRLLVAAALAVAAIWVAIYMRGGSPHPPPHIVLEPLAVGAPAPTVELPDERKLVVAVVIEQIAGTYLKDYMAKVYLPGQGAPVWKEDEMDQKDGKLSLILPVKSVPPGEYVVRIQDKNGDDHEAIYRFATLAKP
jgi:hypothetical protein